MNHKYFYQRGVSLIELIVVLTILILIIGTTTSIFISMISSQGRALKEQELFSQISYATESISRQLSFAVKDNSGSCLGFGYAGHYYVLSHFNSADGFYEGVKFLTKDNVCEEFFLDTDGILKEKKGSGLAQNILSDNFNIKYARFIIDGNKMMQSAPGGNLVQHRITFILDITTKDSQGQQERIVQTTASQRALNTP